MGPNARAHTHVKRDSAHTVQPILLAPTYRRDSVSYRWLLSSSLHRKPSSPSLSIKRILLGRRCASFGADTGLSVRPLLPQSTILVGTVRYTAVGSERHMLFLFRAGNEMSVDGVRDVMDSRCLCQFEVLPLLILRFQVPSERLPTLQKVYMWRMAGGQEHDHF